MTAKKKIRIGFDLDGVIIDKPPFMSKKLLEWLVRSHVNKHLAYRYPKWAFERWIRWLSHHPYLRPPVKENVEFARKLCGKNKFELFVVTSRYAFLEDRTKQWFKYNDLESCFQEFYINIKNEQPHLYKERILKAIKLDVFIDDDMLLIKYLNKKLKNVKIYHVENGNYFNDLI